jgi:ATP-dependent helicase/nuclease subunit A
LSLTKTIWGEDLPLPGLAKDDQQSVWIVVPGKRRQTLLRRSIRADGLQSRVRVLVQGALDRLLAESLELRGQPLGDAQTHALLSRILEERASELSFLHDLVHPTRTEDHVAPGVAVRLREMLDHLRLHESEHRLLEDALDESGSVREERARNFELHLVLQEYEQRLEEGGWEEAISLRRKLADALAAGHVPGTLPDLFVLDQPSYLYRLDQRLWESLARLRPLHLVVDESVAALATRLASEARDALRSVDPARFAPSERHIAALAAWLALERRGLGGLHVLPDRSPGSADLVRALFDGLVPERLDAPAVVLWQEHDRRREVELLVRTVKHGLLHGRFTAAQIQIVAPYLDPYLPLLRRAFAEAGVPCSLPKGEPLWGSAPASVLRALLRWIEAGTSKDLVGYLGNPAVRWPRAGSKELRGFCERHAHRLPAFPAELLGSEAPSWAEHLAADARQLKPFRLDEEARRARVPGGPDIERDWIAPMLAYLSGRLADPALRSEEAARLAGVLADLAVLETAWSRIAPLRSPELDPLEGLARLRTRLREDQAMTGLLRHSLHEQDPGARFLAEIANANRALGEIGRLLRQVEELIRFRREQLGLEDRSFATLRNFLLEHLRGAHLARVPQRDSVIATELLDTRTERYELLFVLGLTQAEFPPLELESYLLPEGLPPHLAKPLDRTQEATWLLGRLLRNSARVVLSCPRHTEEGKTLSATPIEDLARWRGAGRAHLGSLDAPPPEWVASFEELARRRPDHPLLPEPLREAIAHGASALAARSAPQLTVHDGALGPHGLIEEQRRLYSVSQLETFRECPHRYLFQHLLRLRALADIPSELEENRIGTLVHATLARFFGQGGPWHRRKVTAESFDEACAALLQVAHQVLRESAVDWDSGPVLQAQRLEILRGLDEPGDTGKRGYLKAALAFQRDLIGTVPHLCEHAFGQGEVPPLELHGGIQISGAIDRIDLEGEELRIWDYKTGSVQKPGETGSLQIPIYAEAALRHLAPANAERLQIRGGFIALKRRNERDRLDHPIDGVLVEDLAVRKIKNRWQIDPSQSRLRIAAALDEVRRIDEQLRQGRLHQIEETPEGTCERCDYSAICERDVARLQDKLALPQSFLPVPRLPHPPPPSPAGAGEGQGVRAGSGSGTDPGAVTARLATAVQPSLFDDAGQPTAEAPPPRPLSEEQQRAASVDQSVVLTAGAGSGKTRVLETRIARLVRRGVPIDSILAITFTRKAAEEIRSRVARTLGEAIEHGELDGEPLAAEERGHLVDARALLPGAALTTIHGLCQQILRMDPLLSEFDDRAKVLGDAHLIELQSQAVDQALGGHSPCAPAVLRLLGAGLRLDELKTGLSQLIRDESRLNALERNMNAKPEGEWQELCRRIHRQQVDARGRELELWLRPWLAEFDAWMASTEEFDKNRKTKPDQHLHFHQVQSRLHTILRRAAEQGWESQLEELDELLLFLKRHNGSQVQARGGKRNFWKELREELDAVAWPRLSVTFEREAEALDLARSLCRVAREAQAVYSRIKQERAVIDHDDQLTRAYRMLCGRFDEPRLRTRQKSLIERLRTRFTHLLVDEFQDTDPRQWELLQTLLGDRPLQDGAAPSVFLVGDRKQAIYGFRGGENRVFEQARAHLTGRGARSRSLQDNYRSAPVLISAVNALFDAIFASEFEQGDPHGGRRLVETAVAPERMRPAGAAGAAQGTVALLMLPHESGAGERKVREALLVARLVRAALAGELPQYLDLAEAHTDGARVGILCRKVRELMLLADALDRYGVSYTVSHGSGFFLLPEVRALENVLRAIADERNAISTAGVLRGPLFGWSDRDLADAAHALGPFWTRKVLRGSWDDPRGRRVHRMLGRWRRAATVCSTSALLSLIVADAGLAATFEAAGRSEAVANLEKLIDLVYREERIAGGTGLVEIVHWFELQRRSFEGAALPPGRQTPVTLMTVHGAKGLEFPMVVLPFLDKGGREERDFVVSELPGLEGPVLGMQVEEPREAWRRKATFLSQVTAETEKRRSASEEKRLFYVACTRARRHLVLSLRETASFWDELRKRQDLPAETRRKELAEGSDPRAWLTRVLRLPEGLEAPPPRLLLPDARGEPLDVPLLRPEHLSEPDAGAGRLRSGVEPDTAGLASAAATPQVVAASQLHLLQRCPLAYYLGRVAGLLADADAEALVADVEEARPTAVEVGDTVHRLLEAAGGAVAELCRQAPAEMAASVRRLLLQALEEEPSEALVQEVSVHLRRLAALPQWHEVLQRRPDFEVPLETRIQQALLEGSIDAVHREEDGALVLHDFKTTALGGLPPRQVAEEHGYERQLQAYAVAAELMGLGSARDAVLWFTAHGGGPVSVSLTEEHLAQAQQILARAAELSGWTLGEARAQARTDQCRDCRFRPICPEAGSERVMSDE